MPMPRRLSLALFRGGRSFSILWCKGLLTKLRPPGCVRLSSCSSWPRKSSGRMCSAKIRRPPRRRSRGGSRSGVASRRSSVRAAARFGSGRARDHSAKIGPGAGRPGPAGARLQLGADLSFAVSGIEREVVEGAERVTVIEQLDAPVAPTAHLLALKVLAESPERVHDRHDARALIARLSPEGLAQARRLLELISQAGFDRGKNLSAVLRRLGRCGVAREFGCPSRRALRRRCSWLLHDRGRDRRVPRRARSRQLAAAGHDGDRLRSHR